MIRGIDNGLLLGNLETNGFNIIGLGGTDAGNLVYEGDSRLSDARVPNFGSVTDSSVADDAEIDQSKLNLKDTIPNNYLGNTSGTAAQGNLAEYKSKKGLLNGYVGTGADSKILTGFLAATGGTGTLVDIEWQLPFDELDSEVTASTTTRTMLGLWSSQNDGSFLGNMTGASAHPSFSIQPLYLALIPNLPASQFTTGTFALNQLPLAIGVGTGHAKGLAPTTQLSGEPTDYLARDMTYKPSQKPPSYQPQLPAPAITIQQYIGPIAYVNIKAGVNGTNIFYRTPADQGGGGMFAEVTSQPLKIPVGTIIETYVAKIGYLNSNIVSYTVPPIGQS